MKKILALALAACLALTLAACSGNTVSLPQLTLPESSASESGGEQAAPETVGDQEFNDDLSGLCQYLEENYAVAGEKEGMSYQAIGAKGGYRYLFTYEGGTVQAEFYEFDPENLDDAAQACVDSVKEKGWFQMLDNEVQAKLSPNEKYMMIYHDSKEKEEKNAAQRARVEELFDAFHQD